MDTVIDRFMRSVEISDSCWLWSGRIKNGYGYFVIDHRQVRAHRLSFELFVGPIPDGLHLDHLCRVRNCVNPSHLEPVTPRENAMRGVGVASINAAKTECKHGHALTATNVSLRRDAQGRWARRCRECQRLRNREAYWRRKGAR